MLLVVGIILSAGVLGGWVNYNQLDAEKVAKDGTSKAWFKSVLVGIAASSLIPLFLNTISSQLVTEVLASGMSVAQPLVLFGFCVVAAIASNKFIESLSARVLERLEKTEERAKETEDKTNAIETGLKEVEETVDVFREPDTMIPPLTLPGAGNGVGIAGAGTAVPTMSPVESNLLRAMDDSRFKLRSLSGLARDADVTRDAAETALRSLASRGLVRVFQSGHWGATPTTIDLIKSGKIGGSP